MSPRHREKPARSAPGALPGALAARAAALHVLSQALDRRQPLDKLLSEESLNRLSPPDRAFAQLLVKTVLRRLRSIDAMLARYITRPLPPSLSRVQHILRLGAAQLACLHTPPHAAVHSAVELGKYSRLASHAGLINAVLKRVSVDPALPDDPALALPGWLWQRWTKHYGETAARAMAAQQLQEPPLDLFVPREADAWAQKLGGTLLIPQTVRLREAGNITRLAGFAEGAWWVQDLAASLPARLLGDVKDKFIVDLCAAPGGKTAQLAAAGAKVIAVEKQANRVRLLRENMARLKLSVETVCADARIWKPEAPPDAILLDAPCSATGTLRRHPDVAWHRTPEDIARLAATQHELLEAALAMLATGGLLVYAVCSLEPEEGESQIERLLARRKDVNLLPVGPMPSLPQEFFISPSEIRTLPCMGEGMDGFYAALLIKR